MGKGVMRLDKIAAVTEFWDRRPCNIRHSPKPIGTRAYFDEVERRKYFVEPHIPGFANFSAWEGKRVLEIGCGIGTDTVSFARAGARVTAIDLSQKSLDVCRERVECFGLSGRVSVVCANCERLPEFIPVEPYDLVYSFGVIHHTPNPERAVQAIRRFLAPSSEFRFMVYSTVSVKNLQIRLNRTTCEAQSGVPVAFTYTRRELEGLCQGLEIISTQKEHIFPWRIQDYIEYRYVKTWPWRWMSPSLFHWVEKRLGWHWLVRARLVGGNDSFT